MRPNLSRRVYLFGACSLALLSAALGCKEELPASINHAGKFAITAFPNGTDVPTTFSINESSKTGAFSKTIERLDDKKQIGKYEFDYEFTGNDANGCDCYSLDWRITDENSGLRSGTLHMVFDGRTSRTFELDSQIRIRIVAP